MEGIPSKDHEAVRYGSVSTGPEIFSGNLR